jgi:hypothetical protein
LVAVESKEVLEERSANRKKGIRFYELTVINKKGRKGIG